MNIVKKSFVETYSRRKDWSTSNGRELPIVSCSISPVSWLFETSLNTWIFWKIKKGITLDLLNQEIGVLYHLKRYF